MNCDCWDVHANLNLNRDTCGCPCHQEDEKKKKKLIKSIERENRRALVEILQKHFARNK